ncbi:MAG: T9SS type A sorting domain-containing protein [Rhodothermales bacterium]
MLWVWGVSVAGAQSCDPATAESLLNANDVRAKMLNNGGLFWNRQGNVYEVPAGGGNHATFAAGLWLGGYVDGDLRTAASAYGPYEFWPGPYEAVAAGGDCASFDTIFEVSRRDLLALDSGGEPSAHVNHWPWQLGAPVEDGDGNPDNYDLNAGDRPRLYGDEMHWWVMNDIGNVHEQGGSAPLGVEVQVLAFATAAEGYDRTTFYRYTVINKSPDTIRDLQFGIFADTDLGRAFDDYVGSDSSLAMGFSYNADNNDDDVYGLAPPAIGYQLTRTTGFDAMLPNMTSFTYYNGGGGRTGDPHGSSEEFYNYMTSRWLDGSPFTLGGRGADTSGTPVPYAFPGDPERREFWSEINSDGNGTAIAPADRRNVQSVGPVTLAPGDSVEVFVSIITAFGADHLNSVTKLKEKAAELLNRSPESIPRSVGAAEPITMAPEILNVGPYAERQPVAFDLLWSWEGPEMPFQLEVMPVGRPERAEIRDTRLPRASLELDRNTMYAVRVRATDRFSYGPWSERIVFTTGGRPVSMNPITSISITANASGRLDPPVMGAWSADDTGFPTVDGQDRPPAHAQTSGATWVLHTGRDSEFSHSGDYATFLRRSIRTTPSTLLRSDLEIRFTDACRSAWEEAETPVESSPTATGCYGYDRFSQFDGYSLQAVPFELWWTGRDTTGDTSDDVRLIPAVLDVDQDGWGMRDADHPVSDEQDDPQTDWIYAFSPLDTAPGSTGHDVWLQTLISSCYHPGPDCQPNVHGEEVLGRLVFVSVDADGTSPMPEVGTVFRVNVPSVPGPTPGAPSRGQIVQGNQPTFYWEEQVFEADVLQIALDEEFEQVLFEVEGARSGEVVAPVLGAGTYYWRISNEVGTFSEAVPFFIASNVGAESDAALPTEIALTSVYPNPFRDQARVQYTLNGTERAQIDLFDALGRHMGTLQDAVQSAGQHTVLLDAASLPAGLYLVRLRAGGVTSTRSVILTR